MKIQLSKILIVFTILLCFENYAQTTSTYSSNIITSEDLKTILGKWTGSLTYVDYRSNKPYTMPANVNVKQGKNENQLTLLITYPNEPKANSKDKIKLSQDGKKLNKKEVKTKQDMNSGQIQITTEYFGKDNNKEALIRDIYILGEKKFVIRKEVKFETSKEWLKRNEYNFTRLFN
ncbi:MAG: hypothetical protein HKO81_08550 [Flavobacteriaceae bacterium]|nr:hypothetical protein [Bacteroidia bacterium]NNL16675.1 hypothetical protein [Flavobacteriaceae bacterium]